MNLRPCVQMAVVALAVSASSVTARATDMYVSDFVTGIFGKYNTSTGGSPAPGWTSPAVPSATGVAVDAAGFVYLTNQNAGTIGKYDSSGSQVSGWQVTGLAGPRGIAISETLGLLYVAQGTSGLISSYNLATGSQSNANLLGFAVGTPYSVAVDASDCVYVTAQSTGIIYKVDGTTGTTAPGWTNPTAFNSPIGLALDSFGNVYVSSFNGGYVSKFNGTSGTSMGFTSPQWNGSFLPGPQGLAIDAEDNLYVALGSSSNAVGKYRLSDSQPAPGWSYPTGLQQGVLMAIVPEPSAAVLGCLAVVVVGCLSRRRAPLRIGS